MKIRLLGPVISGGGAFKKGEVVDWPDRDAKPLVDAGAAEVVKDKPAPAKKKASKK